MCHLSHQCPFQFHPANRANSSQKVGLMTVMYIACHTHCNLEYPAYYKYGQEIRICAREKLLEAAFCVALFLYTAQHPKLLEMKGGLFLRKTHFFLPFSQSSDLWPIHSVTSILGEAMVGGPGQWPIWTPRHRMGHSPSPGHIDYSNLPSALGCCFLSILKACAFYSVTEQREC